MAWTQQERVLTEAKKRFGPTAYVEDHLNYKLVGYGRGPNKVFGAGDTWQQALDALKEKANR